MEGDKEEEKFKMQCESGTYMCLAILNDQLKLVVINVMSE